MLAAVYSSSQGASLAGQPPTGRYDARRGEILCRAAAVHAVAYSGRLRGVEPVTNRCSVDRSFKYLHVY